MNHTPVSSIILNLCKDLNYSLILDKNQIIVSESVFYEKLKLFDSDSLFSDFDLVIIKYSDLKKDLKFNIEHFLKKINLWGSIFIVAENEEECCDLELTLNEFINITSFKLKSSEDKTLIILFNGFKKISFLNEKDTNYYNFIKARQLKPLNIGLAFLGKNHYDCEKKIIYDCSRNFNLESWHRNDVWAGSYNSFSQIVNESLFSLPNSEFVFWIHPRTCANSDMIEELLLLLCSGYAFVSEINFGLFGCSKQLFRKIGMLDERFVGGECEDLDWFFRLKMHNLSFFERGNEKICVQRQSSWDVFRGLSHTQFEEKWLRVDENKNFNSYRTTWTLSKHFEEEKKFNDKKHRFDIEKTWLDNNYSFGKTWLAEDTMLISIVENNFTEKEEIINSTLLIDIENETIKFEFFCEKLLFIMITVHNKNGVVIYGCRIKNNSWYKIPTSTLMPDEFYEIRVNYGQYRMAHFFVNKIPFHVSINDFAMKIKTATHEI